MRIAVVVLVGALAVAATAGAQPAARSPQVVTLAEALDLAARRAPDAAAATVRLDAARASAAEAGRLPNPAIELRAENWAVGGSDVPEDFFAVATTPIELGGKRGARRTVAQAGIVAAEAASALVRRRVHQDVTSRFFDALRAAARASALSDAERGVAELVRIAARRVEEGVLADAALRRLEAEHARTGAERARAEADRAIAAVQLAARLGLADVTPAVPGGPPPAAAPGPPDGRADLAVARARLEVARRALRFEQALGVPDLAVSGGYKRTGGHNTGVLAVTMAVPFFDRNRAAVAAARGEVRAAELDLEMATLAATGEARATADAARTLAAASTDITTRLVAPATVARDAARSAFLSGAIDLVALLDAERAHTDARIAADTLQFDAWQAAVTARLAAGEDPLP
ncbi:MAG: TolC family protein [Vicinamibacterales bacterium]